LVDEAVNTTVCPEHIAVPVVVMLIVGVVDWLIVMPTLFDNTVLVVAQAEFDVSWHLTESPLLRLELVNEELLLPTLLPSSCH
jgi:hypothetical protein